MSQKQLKVQGKTTDGLKFFDTDISINYEIDDNGGTHIDFGAFHKMLADFTHKSSKELPQPLEELPDDFKIGSYFSRELLLFLLSFKAKGLWMTKCFNGTQESIALCVIGDDGNPLGYDMKTGKIDTTKFVAGEWGTFVTLGQLRAVFPDADFKELSDEEKTTQIVKITDKFK